MPRILLSLLLLTLLSPGILSAESTFTDYPSSTTALAYDGQYFWIGQESKVLKWDKNAGIIAEFTQKDGLPGSWIKEIYIAPDKKTIWAESDSCIARFDGSRWHTFEAMENVPRSPLGKGAFESDGSFWLLTGDGKGVLRFNGKTWTHFLTPDGLASNTVKAIAVDTKDVVWVGTDKGVSAYDGTNWKTYTTVDGLPDDAVNRILVDKNNVKWFGIGGEVGGVARFDGVTWTAYNMKNGLIAAKSVGDMVLGPDNSLYVSLCDIRYVEKIVGAQKPGNGYYSYFAYVYKFYGENVTLVKSQSTGGYSISSFYSPLIVDNTGKLYILSDILSDKSIISGYDRSSPVCAEDNVIWFLEGYSVYRPTQIDGWLVSYNGKERHGYGFGPSKYCFSALEVNPKIEVWTGDTRGGIAVFAENIWKATPYEYSPFGSISCLCSDNEGTVWGGEGNTSELIAFKSQTQIVDSPIPSLYNKYDSDFFSKSIMFDNTNTLWVSYFLKPSTGIGVFSYDNSTWRQYTTADGLINDSVNAIAIDSSNAKWFGTASGISRFDGASWTSFPTAENGNPVGNVNVLTFDSKSTLWAGTNTGLLRYNGSSWTRFTPKEGLADTLVLSLAVESDGMVWAGTPNGLSRYDGKTWKTFTTSDGLPSNRVQALAVDHNDVVWIGTDKGLVSYRGEDIPVFVAEEASKPGTFPVLSVYPNPFNPSTLIECTIPGSGLSELTVYSITGQRIKAVASGNLSAGKHRFLWDGKDDAGHAVSSGTYIARLKTGNAFTAKKMVLVR